MSADDHDEHSSFIKTPQQLIVVILLAFLVPIIGIMLIVQLVISTPSADANAKTPESVAARLQPVDNKVEVGAPAAAPGARSGEEIVKGVCATCHGGAVPTAPKIGDASRWGALAKEGLPKLVATATKGTDKGMPAKGGANDLTEIELARAIVYMANQSGQSLKEPAAAGKAAAKSAKK